MKLSTRRAAPGQARWLLVLAVFVSGSCGDSSSGLEGAWHQVGGKGNLAFSRDSVLVWSDGEALHAIFRPWRYVDSAKIVVGEGAGTSVHEIELSGELLTFGGEGQYVKETLTENDWAYQWLEGDLSTDGYRLLVDSATTSMTRETEKREADEVQQRLARRAEENRQRTAKNQALYESSQATAAMVQEGRNIFDGAGICFSCHGSDAEGITGLAPDLTDTEWLHSDGSYESIVQTILRGVTASGSTSGIPMPARAGTNISDQQVRAVAAYVYTLSP